jgi:hypothetical protein
LPTTTTGPTFAFPPPLTIGVTAPPFPNLTGSVPTTVGLSLPR